MCKNALPYRTAENVSFQEEHIFLFENIAAVKSDDMIKAFKASRNMYYKSLEE